MSSRLPWQHHELGFVAYPLGEELKRAYAMLRYNGALPKDAGQWEWNVTVRPAGHHVPGDVVAQNGNAGDRQAAADAATTAWPYVLEEAKAKGLV